MTTPIEALTHLSRQDPTHDDFLAFQAEIKDETNNRGVAALLAANADIALRVAIDRNLLVREDHFQDLFSPRGILNSFEAKVRIGYHMGHLWRSTQKQSRLHSGCQERICACTQASHFRHAPGQGCLRSYDDA
jgi:hypothetical protein